MAELHASLRVGAEWKYSWPMHVLAHLYWEDLTPHKRAHVVLPDDLLAEVDALVGPRGRNAFLTEVIREAVNRRRLFEFLSSTEPILKDEDYPEFRDGAETWVRKMRDQDLRLERENLGDWLERGRREE